jgi:hypothetical protein
MMTSGTVQGVIFDLLLSSQANRRFSTYFSAAHPSYFLNVRKSFAVNVGLVQ